MQKLAVVYFPKTNLDKINAFREKYDPNSRIIPPHITIVSPFSEISESQLIEHVEKVTKDIKSFSIRLTGLTKTFDDCLFLLVKEGKEKIINLHDQLYSGILTPYLPTDYPFIPHITLGYFGAKDHNLYKEAEKASFDLSCAFDTVSVIKGDGLTLAKIIRTFNLN